LESHDARLREPNLRGGQTCLAFAQRALGDTRVDSLSCRSQLLCTSRTPRGSGHLERPPGFLDAACGDGACLRQRLDPGELRLRAGEVGVCLAQPFARDHGAHLAQLFNPTAGLRDSGTCLRHRRTRFPVVNLHEEIAALHTVSFPDRHLLDAARCLRRQLHAGNHAHAATGHQVLLDLRPRDDGHRHERTSYLEHENYARRDHNGERDPDTRPAGDRRGGRHPPGSLRSDMIAGVSAHSAPLSRSRDRTRTPG
jgi:hypothetical protein